MKKSPFLHSLLFVSFLSLAGLVSPALAADETPDFTAETLTGNWAGARTRLYNAGVNVEAAYTGDVLSNVDGGIKHGTNYIDNLDVTMTVDGEKLYGLKGSTIFIYLLNNNGPAFNSSYVGSNDGISNIEVARTGFKLYEAWIEQAFFDEKFSLRGGLYDLNSEFNVTDSSGVFLNPTFGIDTAYAATGSAGPSIFPTTSLALRAKYMPTENWYLQAAILDGVPGDPDNRGTAIDLDDKDGALVAGEVGYGAVAKGRVAVGGWWYTSHFDHLVDVDDNGNPLRRRSTGAYVVAEKTLYTPDAGGERHLDGFIRMAGTSGTVSNYSSSGSIGVAYTGPFASRAEDVAGIAFHGAVNSDPYRRANDPLNANEWGIEATYAAQLTPWLSLQPDLQFVSNPGSAPGTDDALVTGIRMGLAL